MFQVLYFLCFARPRYRVSVYRTIGPLVLHVELKCARAHYVHPNNDAKRFQFGHVRALR